MNEIKKLIDDLAAQAQKIAGISLDEVVDDVDLLTVALATSNLTVIARTLSFAKEGEKGYIAAHRALDIGWKPMLMLTPYDVARLTGLSYAKALLLIKSANHIQINNRYYISETSLRAFLNPDTPMLIEEDGK